MTCARTGDLDNLCPPCSAHRRLVHELGWTVSGNANRALVFRRPDGSVVVPGPQPLRPETREPLLRTVLTGPAGTTFAFTMPLARRA